MATESYIADGLILGCSISYIADKWARISPTAHSYITDRESYIADLSSRSQPEPMRPGVIQGFESFAQ
uniref:Uncharacterized protein n=1 Tax=Pseudomonas syringae pv. actinidiae TaxID=103796 RepID=A0A247ZLC8_PSESF|nr:hypothetical protein [Pseudomonas syringae pv. actinidiae]